MPTITEAQTVPDSAHGVSDSIDATETLYRLTVDEYERIAGLLDDDRVELIDGFLVKKMVKNPPHVVGCARTVAAVSRFEGWHARPGEPVRLGRRMEPEPDVSLARGTIDDYSDHHPGPEDIAMVVEVADTTLAKDRRRRRTYAAANIPVYWIVNLIDQQVEVYMSPMSGVYAVSNLYKPGDEVPVVIEGVIVGQIAVTAILP
jgi:Uma2 family endonuclease